MTLAPICLVLFVGCGLATAASNEANRVDVELVLAVDVSSSMDRGEFALQKAGYVDAIRHPDFARAILAGYRGRIALTYFEWAHGIHEESLISWQVIDGLDSAVAFAARLAATSTDGAGGTSISGALSYAASLFAQNDVTGERRVIDISGDGPNNVGSPVTAARDAAVAQGIVINGLPIMIRPSQSSSALGRLDDYYAECVTGGPGSFVLPIHAASEFATSIRRKLILEVSGMPRRPVALRAHAPIDCMIGEHYRLPFPDD